MNDKKKYVLFGTPIPLQRPRYSPGKIWDSQKAAKITCSSQLEDQHGKSPLFSGPLHMSVTFYMPIPKTCAKKRIPTTQNSYHSIKPDISNLLKFYEDIANGILYKDDACICSTHAEKRYDDGCGVRTEIELWEMK